MDTVYLGFIGMFGFGFTPAAWQSCEGQLLSISANQALFSLLGTAYGGDGRTTFALPDLRGRVPIHQGQGPGLSHYTLGQRVGVESTSLTVQEMPAHDHQATATSTLVAEASAADSQNPQGRMLAAAQVYTATDPAENRELADESVSTVVQVGMAGAGQPMDLRQPVLAVNFCIAVQGIFPPRS